MKLCELSNFSVPPIFIWEPDIAKNHLEDFLKIHILDLN